MAPTRSPAEVMDFRVRDPALMALRASALASAELALARGDTDAAIADFDRAAMMLHAADTEMGLVRAHLQAGEYRRALRRGDQLGERVRRGEEEAALAQVRYAHGLTTYVPLLNALATVIQARRDQAESMARTQTALVALYKSLGDDVLR